MLLPPANEVWGNVIFSEACVKNSVHSGGGGGESASVHAGIPPPPEQSMLEDTVNERAVCILLECNLVTVMFLNCSVRREFLVNGRTCRYCVPFVSPFLTTTLF